MAELVKNIDGKQMILYNIHAMKIEVPIEEFMDIGNLEHITKELKEAVKTFWSNPDEDWMCCMGPREIEEFFEDKIFIREYKEICSGLGTYHLGIFCREDCGNVAECKAETNKKIGIPS